MIMPFTFPWLSITNMIYRIKKQKGTHYPFMQSRSHPSYLTHTDTDGFLLHSENRPGDFCSNQKSILTFLYGWQGPEELATATTQVQLSIGFRFTLSQGFAEVRPAQYLLSLCHRAFAHGTSTCRASCHKVYYNLGLLCYFFNFNFYFFFFFFFLSLL